MAFENFPYTDYHALNLDWLLKKVKDLEMLTKEEITEAVEALVKEIFADAAVNMAYDADTKTLKLTIGSEESTDNDVVKYIDLENLHLEIVDQTARNDLERPTTYSYGYYNVLAYGAKGDGATDDKAAIQNVLNLCKEKGGGLVFFPAGTYNISDNLVVPDNTTIMGVGPKSKIYMTTSGNWSGEVICVCGNNVKIANISGDLLNHGETFIDGNANMGFIGIGNLTYDGVLHKQTGAVNITRSNVVIEDVYTEAYYAVQAEIANDACYMNDITYNRIIAPNGCISMQGTRHNRAMKNCSINNCRCAYLRIGAGAGGWDQDIHVNNVVCCYTRIYCRGGSLENIHVNVDTGNVFYTNRATWVPNNGTIACVILGGTDLHHIQVDGNSASGIEYGMNILATTDTITRLFGCTITGIRNEGNAQRAFYSSNGTYWVIGCSFDGPTSSIPTGYNLGSTVVSPTSPLMTPNYQ